MKNRKKTTHKELRILLKAMYEQSFGEKEATDELPLILRDF